MDKVKIRLSYSTMQQFHSCERKFQLNKLLTGAVRDEDTPSTVYGKAFGAAVGTYLLTQDRDKALLDLYINYEPVVEDEKKNMWNCIHNMEAVFPVLDSLLMEWEVAFFKEKHAIELSFKIEGLSNEDKNDLYFVGYVDVVLRNRFTGMYAILENKTTALNSLDLTPYYQNSEQATGYSIVLDTIAGAEHVEYGVIYLVSQIGINPFSSKAHLLYFNKTITDRFNWFMTLGLDIQRLELMLEHEIFPLRNNCMDYRRKCKFFGTCQLRDYDTWKEPEEDKINYDFTFSLEKILENHLNRI